MRKSRLVVTLILAAIFVGTSVQVIQRRISIARTDAELERMEELIRLQKMKNSEYSDILSEDNIEDFYKNIAEDSLGYGFNDEKIYVDITGY